MILERTSDGLRFKDGVEGVFFSADETGETVLIMVLCFVVFSKFPRDLKFALIVGEAGCLFVVVLLWEESVVNTNKQSQGHKKLYIQKSINYFFVLPYSKASKPLTYLVIFKLGRAVTFLSILREENLWP